MSKATENTMKTKVTEMLTAGERIGKIEGYLLYEHDLSTNEAKQFVSDTREELGIESRGQGPVKLPEIVAYLRANTGKLEKKELINGMMEVSGHTYSTCQHMYNYIAMAQEWARQETEA